MPTRLGEWSPRAPLHLAVLLVVVLVMACSNGSDSPTTEALGDETTSSVVPSTVSRSSTTLLETTDECGELDSFEPRETAAYLDYPIHGETEEMQYRSYLDAASVPIVVNAAETVRDRAKSWSPGHGAPIGLGDMSECDGSIPGTSVGEPDHPAATHEDGRDIDVAYYQVDTPDNRLRSVCDSELDGHDQNRCVSPPDHLDSRRTALFVDALAATGRIRVIGVDGMIGPILKEELDALCRDQISTCAEVPLAYETTDTGLGWFHAHHHHMHVSFLLDSDD